MDNLALCESQTLRSEKLNNVSQERAREIIDKVKFLLFAYWRGEAFAATDQIADYYEVSPETISSVVKRNRSEFESDGLRVIQGRELKQHKFDLNLCCKDARVTIWTPRASLRCGLVLRDSEIAKQVRTTLLDLAGSEAYRSRLESQMLPAPSLKEINEVAKIYEDLYGIGYKQRYIQQKLSRFYPALAGDSPLPQESISLCTPQSLLTPTQLAQELGLTYSTGRANPQAVNSLLEKLGYQEKIAGAWSATRKAIDSSLCDRKPVDTNSKTQKDQLLWAANMIAILQEYV